MPDIQGIKIYYGPGDTNDDAYGIVPAPQINISYEPIYSNDSAIGLTTKMTLNGVVSSFIANKEFNFQTNNFENQEFTAQINSGPNILSTESGDQGVLSENDKIIVLALGTGIFVNYLKFTPFGRRDNDSANIYGLNEFKLFLGSTQLDISNAIVTSPGYSGTPLSYLIDGIDTNKVYPFSGELIIEFPYPISFDTYTFTYFNSPSGIPYENISSNTSIAVNTGVQTLTVSTTSGLVVDQVIRVYNSTNANIYMEGTINNISGNDISINVITTNGTGSYSSWSFNGNPLSDTSASISLGEKTFTTNNTSGLSVGDRIRVVNPSDISIFVEGIINNIDGNDITIDVDIINGNGTYTNWEVVSNPSYGDTPSKWKLEGSDDGINWTVIDDQTGGDTTLPPAPPGGGGGGDSNTPIDPTIPPPPPPPPVTDEGGWQITNIQNEKANNVRLITDQITKIKKVLSVNGYNLIIRDNNENVIIKGVGGVLKSLSFENGTNAWTQTVPFSAEIEFNYISFFGEDLACSGQIDGDIVDLSNYSLKSFSDGWSFNIGGDAFNYIGSAVSGNNIINNVIELSYTISATGKDYYDESSTSGRKLKPAWETAKHFVQNRLYDQVTTILSSALPVSSGDGCSYTASSGIIADLANDYNIFNETINCSFSETEGSFSATYNSILKKKSEGSLYDSDNTKHTITKNTTYNHEDQSYDISINGSIEGLILGGLINSSKAGFSLPNNGSLLVTAYSENSKYTNALNLWNTISSSGDITNNFKDALGIAYSNMNTNNCISTIYPPSNQFNVVKNLIDGTIEYSASFNNKIILSNNNRSQSIQSVVIDYADSTPVFAEFTTLNGPVLQDIKTRTNTEISFNINGRDDSYKLTTPFTTFPSSYIITIAGTTIEPPALIAANFPDYSDFVLKGRSQNINMLDGTYSIQLIYACSTGCTV